MVCESETSETCVFWTIQHYLLNGLSITGIHKQCRHYGCMKDHNGWGTFEPKEYCGQYHPIWFQIIVQIQSNKKKQLSTDIWDRHINQWKRIKKVIYKYTQLYLPDYFYRIQEKKQTKTTRKNKNKQKKHWRKYSVPKKWWYSIFICRNGVVRFYLSLRKKKTKLQMHQTSHPKN